VGEEVRLASRDGEDVGRVFQQETKYERGSLRGRRLDWGNKPPTYKRYSDAARIPLSEPETGDGLSLWAVLSERRSQRQFRQASISVAALSQLLWAAQGITERRRNIELRTAPSAGALYPIETYLVIHDVETIEPGIYHYDVQGHQLEQLREGVFREEIARAALDQRMAGLANVVFVWTAVFGRSTWKYRQRGYRYVYLDAGHIAQNVALAAVALGLGSCQIAALYDREANALLGVDGSEESTVYMTVVGEPS
jgi:SagB-type dehydrogenase family enzyme